MLLDIQVILLGMEILGTVGTSAGYGDGSVTTGHESCVVGDGGTWSQ